MLSILIMYREQRQCILLFYYFDLPVNNKIIKYLLITSNLERGKNLSYSKRIKKHLSDIEGVKMGIRAKNT